MDRIVEIRYPGSCVRGAMNDAGIQTDIKDWVTGQDLIQWCDDKEIPFYHQGNPPSGQFEVGDPMIVIYEITPGRAHAVFSRDARDINKVLGIISLKEYL